MLKLENFITVFAMKRTGHHAIISWLLKQFPPPKYFLNDRIPYKDIFNQKFDKIKKETKKDYQSKNLQDKEDGISPFE